jgi:hypothetical protein
LVEVASLVKKLSHRFNPETLARGHDDTNHAEEKNGGFIGLCVRPSGG